MSNLDSLQRFMFANGNARGHIVKLGPSYQHILQLRPYPAEVKRLLGEALLSCLLLAESIKFEGSISLQFQGDDNLPLILVQCDNNLKVRAVANYKENASTADYKAAFLKGQMALTIQEANQKNSYQSIVSIFSDRMADNLMRYFALSEQLPTIVQLATTEEMGAGIMTQLLPGLDSSERDHFWSYVSHIANTLKDAELLQLDNHTLLNRLYHETDVLLYEPRHPLFQCRCTPERMKQVLTTLGEEDIQALLREKKLISVKCEFCHHLYEYDAIDIALLFNKPN